MSELNKLKKEHADLVDHYARLVNFERQRNIAEYERQEALKDDLEELKRLSKDTGYGIIALVASGLIVGFIMLTFFT